MINNYNLVEDPVSELENRLKLFLIQKLKQLSNEEFSFTSLISLIKLIKSITDPVKNQFSKKCDLDSLNKEFDDKFLSVYSIDSIRNEFFNQYKRSSSLYSISLSNILSSLNNLAYEKNSLIKHLLLNVVTSRNSCETFEILYEYCSNLRYGAI
jgi:hypothetical protein